MKHLITLVTLGLGALLLSACGSTESGVCPITGARGARPAGMGHGHQAKKDCADKQACATKCCASKSACTSATKACDSSKATKCTGTTCPITGATGEKPAEAAAPAASTSAAPSCCSSTKAS